MEIKAKVTEIQCKCVSINRTSTANSENGWDASRKCFRYAATFVPLDDDADDIFSQMDMFRKDYRIPLRDEVLRKKYAAQAATADDDEAKIAAWDNIVSNELVNKTAKVKTLTLSVSELTGGAYASYVLEIGNEKIEVVSRTISCLGDVEAAVGRVANQVMRACKEQNKQEGDEG